MNKVTVVGAGKYGSMTALRIAEYNIVQEVVMTDIVEGLPQGLALDINQSRFVEQFNTKLIGTNDYKDTEGSDVVVLTAGLPRKPGMSRMDLLEVNAKIVEGVTQEILKHSDNPSIVVVTNPLDQMTTLAADVSGLPKNKVTPNKEEMKRIKKESLKIKNSKGIFLNKTLYKLYMCQNDFLMIYINHFHKKQSL